MDHIIIHEVSVPMGPEQFGEELEKYRKDLMLFFKRLYPGYSREEVEDLTQETFTTGIERRDSYDEEGKMRAWLCTIGRSVASEKKRRDGAQKRGGNPNLCTLDEEHLHLTDSRRPADLAPLADTVHQRLDGLPAEARRVVQMRAQGWTLQQIAIVQKMQSGAVRRLYEKAITILSEEWQP